jgi:uncharacterized protein (TIGR02145 family)
MKSIHPRYAGSVVTLLLLPFAAILLITGCNYILPNKPPYVEKTSPADSALYIVGESIVFEVNAWDVDGSVEYVAFTPPGGEEFRDNSMPYEYTWQTAGMLAGVHSVEIKAIDNKGEPYIIKAPVRLVAQLTADAGPDTVYTDSRTSCVLQAASPLSGQGTWTIISGTGGQISDVHNPNATLTGQACQSYALRWTVAFGFNQVSDEVTIGFSWQPSKADAGDDQTITDGTTKAILQAVTPTSGSGSWRIISGSNGSLSDASSPVAVFTGQPCGSYQLEWTVSTTCNQSVDTVNIRFDQYLSDPNAGPDQSFNDGRNSANLAAVAPITGQGVWSVVSGSGGSFSNNSDPHAVFTGQLCQTYVLRWTVTTPCSSKWDEVTITFLHTPTPANAGTDIAVNGPTLTIKLGGNAPVRGTGTWTVVSGTGGSFADLHNPATDFTGNPCQSYVLRWTIATACESSSDEVSVSFSDMPSTSNAGPDQELTDGSIYTQLQATPPTHGTGIWTIVSGDGGSVSDPADPHSIFAGLLCHTYVLRWTVSTPCSSSFDEVSITFNQLEMTADAGPDRRISDGSGFTYLQGNIPKPGMTGTWTILAGEGGVLEDIHDPATKFEGVGGQIYRLKWSLTSACIENSDMVTIAFIPQSTLLDSRDGKTYYAVKIGNQFWMSENLNYAAAGSFAYENNSDAASVYGRLYDWNTAKSICPDGWHLPTDLEWQQLEKFLGMDPSTALLEWYRGHEEGGMLKEAGTIFWDAPNTGATNISGFTGRPGGYRTPGGVFGGLRSIGSFWSDTGNTSGKAIYRALSKDKSQIGRDWYDQGYGFSVRCVKY